MQSSRQLHYVYVLLRNNDIPFYVGKGTIGPGTPRLFQHEAEAQSHRKSYKTNIIRVLWRIKLNITYIVDSFFSEEQEAFARERVLICSIGRHDLKQGPLANLTDGGEGTSNPSEESKEMRRQTLYGSDSDSSERAIANRFFQRLCDDVRSVPVKPASEFEVRALKPIRKPVKEPDGFTKRQAAALAASAIVNRVKLEDGCCIRRRFSIDGVELVIENGAGGRILKSGMATLAPGSTPGHEVFVLGRSAVEYISSVVDKATLEDAGIIEPVLEMD